MSTQVTVNQKSAKWIRKVSCLQEITTMTSQVLQACRVWPSFSSFSMDSEQTAFTIYYAYFESIWD